MCGIAGFSLLTDTREGLGTTVSKMGAALIHRGPDGYGETVDESWGAALCCRRLSLVGHDSGDQPIWNEDESIGVVANGEIYNWRQLAEELQSRGHILRTGSDVEVIVHLYEEIGDDCFEQLNGMFGVAIIDRSKHRLVLARDRSGMKPLYCARAGGGLLFASEIKALFSSGRVTPEPDSHAISTYLAIGYTPAPATCFVGVEKIPAGECWTFDATGLRRRVYWRLRFENRQTKPTERELSTELEGLLDRAVKTHIQADVPVGAFLSGGWDSSLVATLAASHLQRPIKTFTITFPESAHLNEAGFAREVADHIGSEHHEVEFRGEMIPDLLPKVVRGLDTPCLASPALLQYRLASSAAGVVKSLLGGEGADEQFAGYSWLAPSPAYALQPWVPSGWGQRAADYASDFRVRRLLRQVSARDAMAADAEGYRLLSPRERRHILPWCDEGESDLESVRLDAETAASCRDELDRRLALEFTRRLPDGLLMVNDRMYMAHSLEVRMPFLDNSIIEFARHLPSSLKRRGKQEKYLLAELVRRHLPLRIAQRKKFPMQAPMNQYFAGPLRSYLRDMLLDRSRDGAPFKRAVLEPVLENWLRESNRDRFLRRPIALLFFQVWWSEFFSRH